MSVTVTVDGEKEVVFEMKFSYDKDGLIDGVWYEPEGMNIVEVIRGEGMLFEEKTYKPEEELYGLPAVKLSMLDGKELLEVWKNADRKYGHPVIILNDRLVEEMLEDGEYEEGELPDIDEYLSEYIEELEESEYKEDIMGSPEDTGDPLTKFLTPFMSEEERWLVWVPVAEPWLIFEKLPIGGWNECPDANHMAAFSKKVNTISGAVPALISGATLEYYTPRRLNDDEALPMALDMYGFCSDIDGVYALADALLKSDIWYFWWD